MTPTPETLRLHERLFAEYEAWWHKQDAKDTDILTWLKKRLEAAEKQAELLAQRVTVEAAWRVADAEHRDYGLACYMLRDLPLSKAAGMNDMLWALHHEGSAAKGDWELVRDKWLEAYRAALAPKETKHIHPMTLRECMDAEESP